jgi:uncharacterized protein YkwD
MKRSSRHRRARPGRSTRPDRAADPRASSRRRVRRVLVSAFLALATGVAAFFGAAVVTGRLGATAALPAAMIAGEPVSSTAQTARESLTAVTDRGTVKGTLRLITPVTGSNLRVTYVLQGPRTVVQVADSAPYELVLDTRTLPNGAYTVKEVVFHAGTSPRMTTSRLVVRNPGTGVALTATVGPPSFPNAATPTTAGAGTATTPTATAGGPAAPAPAGTPTSLGAVPVVPVGPVTSATPAVAPAAGEAVRAQVVTLTNAERAKVGCPALTVDVRLASAAQEHSQDMAAHNYFDHNSLDGRTAFERITDAGYPYTAAAENIAAGQQSAAAVMAGWMGSTGHRANILNCSLTQIGIGYVTGGSYGFYWTQDFGTP